MALLYQKRHSRLRLGCDLVNLTRFKKILMRTPAMRGRIFLPSEEKDASLETLAGIFAAKEAVIKALGFSAGRWRDIEISARADGKPGIRVLEEKRATGYQAVDLSISHDGDYVIAFVVSLSE